MSYVLCFQNWLFSSWCLHWMLTRVTNYTVLGKLKYAVFRLYFNCVSKPKSVKSGYTKDQEDQSHICFADWYSKRLYRMYCLCLSGTTQLFEKQKTKKQSVPLINCSGCLHIKYCITECWKLSVFVQELYWNYCLWIVRLLRLLDHFDNPVSIIFFCKNCKCLHVLL